VRIVDNPFDRPLAMNLETWSQDRAIPQDCAATNELLGELDYAAGRKSRHGCRARQQLPRIPDGHPPSGPPERAMRAASAPANIASIDATTEIAMTTTEARIEVLAAAVRAMAQVLPPEQSAMASALFLRHVASLGREQLSDLADQAAAAEIVGVMMSLAR
jgi:hypothetical protein